MLLGLFDRLQRMLPLAKTVAEEIVCEETEVLEEIIPRMFEVMQRVAKFSCGYVKRGRFGGQPSLLLDSAVLIIAERTAGGLIGSKDKEMIDEMDGELSKVIDDFARAVDVEAVRLARKIGKHSLSQAGDNSFSVVHVEQKLLLKQLKSVEAGHHLDRRCMKGTRQSILNRIMAWVTNPLG